MKKVLVVGALCALLSTGVFASEAANNNCQNQKTGTDMTGLFYLHGFCTSQFEVPKGKNIFNVYSEIMTFFEETDREHFSDSLSNNHENLDGFCQFVHHRMSLFLEQHADRKSNEIKRVSGN